MPQNQPATATDSQETLEKYDRESNIRDGLPRTWMISITAISSALALFHLYTSFAGPLVDVMQRSIHLYTLMGLTFMLFPVVRSGSRDRIPWIDVFLALASFAIGIYMLTAASRVIESAGRINTTDVYVGLAAIALVIEAARRVTGLGLPILAVGFLVYGFFAKLSRYSVLTEPIAWSTIQQVISHLVYITEGMLGTAVAVSASYIILFILFGAFLGKSGLGQLFNDLALAIAGPTRGGPAKVAVVASSFLGSINGSAIANAVTTGSFTIPLMKRTGYRNNFAGAVEAAASVGGQVLPPIMGAAVFIMAEVLSVPYKQVMLAGIIPALLYYLGILFQVHLRALRNGLSGIPRSELTPAREVILKRGHLLVPMAILLWMIFDGRAPFFAAFWSIAATVLICGTTRLVTGVTSALAALIMQPQWLALLHGDPMPDLASGRLWLLGVIALPVAINLVRSSLPIDNTEIMDVGDCRDAMVEGVRNAIPVAMACGAVGIIVGVATLTGIALDAADWVVSMGQMIPWDMLRLLVTLALTMAASIMLGMGLPSIPCYIITSTMAAPILLNLPLFQELAGSNDTAVFVAHMFVFYFGIFANLTPPVALAAYAASGVSGGAPNATGFQSMKLAIAGFVVPYMFVFSHQMLLLDATWGNVVTIVATATFGVLLLAVAAEGYLRRQLNAVLRVLAFIGAIALMYPGWISNAAGFLIALALFLIGSKTIAGTHKAASAAASD
ncbi:TRAP transporter permease [Salinisphaera sp. USBA-960]|uniref:TRAP transporter permease n=1 Tax=Salinisphaera orenii TaxID=856731 RepID=UPI000DBE0058|nr:TRAP transporter permease [Salifodinibacter halophilus]NNC26282.1 TRAP transporter permease [Salifodinibacter halophilus]